MIPATDHERRAAAELLGLDLDDVLDAHLDQIENVLVLVKRDRTAVRVSAAILPAPPQPHRPTLAEMQRIVELLISVTRDELASIGRAAAIMLGGAPDGPQ